MTISSDPARAFSRAAMSAEMLDADVETRLALAWRDERCEQSLHRLTNAYMRLAISIAYKFKRYSGSMEDLIQEAGIGLMKAAEKFDPDRGVRFSTYAQWWIKASIQDFVMRNYSMVRTGSTSSQKSLFFNMKRVAAQIERQAEAEGITLESHILTQKIADELGVPVRDVEMMQGRLMGSDYSLNAQQSTEDEGREWQDTLADESPQAAEVVERDHDLSQMRKWLTEAMQSLSERERYIVVQRKMIDEPRTLESLGEELKLSKERIRQIEGAALEKLKKRLERTNGAEASLLLAV